MKLVIVTGTWGRPKVFDLFARGVKDLDIDGLDIECVVAGSEGKWSRERVKKHGFHYIEIENTPLATKMNSTLLKAQKLKADYVLFMGSDDIISNELLEIYFTYMKQKVDFIGVTDFYFYDLVTKKALYWGGYRERYRKGHTCGAARVMSANLLDKLNWRCWEDDLSHYLDTSMQDKLKKVDYDYITFSMRQHGVIAVDIKSRENMTPFARWDNADFIKPQIITKHFPYLCAV